MTAENKPSVHLVSTKSISIETTQREWVKNEYKNITTRQTLIEMDRKTFSTRLENTVDYSGF